MFSKEDVEELFNKFKDYVYDKSYREMSDYLSMNAIFVQLLLHDAEKQTVTLQAETAQMESMKNMQEINKFIASISDLTLPDSKTGVGKLGSISNVANLIDNYESLKHDYELLNQKVDMLTNQNNMLIQQNNNLQKNSTKDTEIVAKLQNEIKTLTLKSNNSKENQKNIDALKRLENECEAKKKELDTQLSKYNQLLADYDKRVSEAPQFKTLKKLLQDKNTLVVQLKTKIAKYEEKYGEKEVTSIL